MLRLHQVLHVDAVEHIYYEANGQSVENWVLESELQKDDGPGYQDWEYEIDQAHRGFFCWIYIVQYHLD